MSKSLGLTSHNSSCNCTGCGMLRARVCINCAERVAALLLESGLQELAVEPCSGRLPRGQSSCTSPRRQSADARLSRHVGRDNLGGRNAHCRVAARSECSGRRVPGEGWSAPGNLHTRTAPEQFATILLPNSVSQGKNKTNQGLRPNRKNPTKTALCETARHRTKQ